MDEMDGMFISFLITQKIDCIKLNKWARKKTKVEG
jgi:hypothetical protein